MNTLNALFCFFLLALKAFRLELNAVEILFRTVLVNLLSVYPTPDQIYLL